MTSDTVHSYTYDAEGNITKVDGGSTAQYVYDVFNHRIHVQTPSATNEYVYDPMGHRVSTWLSPNNFGSEGRIYWDGRQIAYRSIDGTTYFDHQDMLGTERMRTNYSGAVGSTYASLPWGDGYTATINTSGADQDNGHYAGLDRDAESGTEHAQFRNYASVQGRWLAPDPYMGSYDLTNPQSMNRYEYVLNNPTSLLDPSGQDPTCSIDPDTGLLECTSYYSGDGGDGGDLLCWWCMEYGGGGPIDCWWCNRGGGSPPAGGSGSSAPTLGPPRLATLSNARNNTQRSCVAGVLGENAVSLGLDALGTLPIPEAGGITRLVGQQLGAAKIGAIYRGVVADQQGANLLNGLRNSTSAVALSGNSGDTSALGLASTAVGGAALTAGYFVPVLGQVLSGGQLIIDAIHTYNTIQTKCYGHS